MHLCGPALTTTSYKKKKDKITKTKQAELELGWRERNQRLKEMKLPKETFEQYLEWVYGTGKKTSRQTNNSCKSQTPVYKETIGGAHNNPSVQGKVSLAETDVRANRPTAWVTGACSTKPSPKYTGSEMIGITVLHKSCLQPVFSKEAAEDAAKMRR